MRIITTFYFQSLRKGIHSFALSLSQWLVMKILHRERKARQMFKPWLILCICMRYLVAPKILGSASSTPLWSQVRIQSISRLSKDSLKEPAQLVEADEPTDQPKTPPRDKDICFAIRIHMNPFCGCQWDTRVECSTNKLAT